MLLPSRLRRRSEVGKDGNMTVVFLVVFLAGIDRQDRPPLLEMIFFPLQHFLLRPSPSVPIATKKFPQRNIQKSPHQATCSGPSTTSRPRTAPAATSRFTWACSASASSRRQRIACCRAATTTSPVFGGSRSTAPTMIWLRSSGSAGATRFRRAVSAGKRRSCWWSCR